MRAEVRERKQREAVDTPGDYQKRALEEGSSVQRYWHRTKHALLEWFFTPRPGERVLDVGCGSGVFSDRMASLGASVTAIDANEAAIAWARQTFERPGLEFHLGLLEDLDVEAASFDHAVCLEVIEHVTVEQSRSLLAHLRRALRPGGTLLLTTPNYRGLWPLVEWGADRFSEVAQMGGLQHITHYHRGRLQRLLAEEGFEVVRVRTFSTFAPFVAALSTGMADRVDALERKVDLPFGNLLAVVARPALVKEP
jgi:2-polyprenyl-3-methyl-5-hydroxy-6-metoxy-1,4-benzoquinol methylase